MFVYFLFGIMNPKNSVLRMYIPTPGEKIVGTIKSISTRLLFQTFILGRECKLFDIIHTSYEPGVWGMVDKVLGVWRGQVDQDSSIHHRTLETTNSLSLNNTHV